MIKKRFQYLVVPILILALAAIGVGLARAGILDSPAAPGSTSSFTLEDIWNRLDSGAEPTASTFSEPSVGPGTSTMHSLDEIMAAAPAPDDTNGAMPSDVASGQTFWGLTSGQWGLQTGTHSRFTDHGDGTVTDNLTGYMWTKSADHGLYDWYDANIYAFDLRTGGYSDWEVPEVWELFTLVDERKANPSLTDGHPFTGVHIYPYWSNTDYGDDKNLAYLLTFWDGDIASGGVKVLDFYVWPMRKQ